MLAKLLKYEFKATGRYFLPLFVAMLGMAVVCRVCYSFDAAVDYLPTIIVTMVFFAIIVATFVLAFIITIKRFHTSLLTDEGYLMMTLPVSVHQHIWSKTITAGVWIIGSSLVTGISVLIMFINAEAWNEILAAFKEVMNVLGFKESFNLILWIVLALIILAVDICQKLNSVYMCIAVGSLCSKHKILLGIGACVAYMIIVETIGTVIMKIFSAFGFVNWFTALGDYIQVYLVLAIVFVVDVLLLAAVYSVTTYILKNRLNLE